MCIWSQILQLYSSCGLTSAWYARDFTSGFDICKFLFKYPRDLFPFEVILSMWVFHLSFDCSVTPRFDAFNFRLYNCNKWKEILHLDFWVFHQRCLMSSKVRTKLDPILYIPLKPRPNIQISTMVGLGVLIHLFCLYKEPSVTLSL